MVSPTVARHDIDGSSNEKIPKDNQIENQYPYDDHLPPDPDAHLSAEERAAIVRFPRPPNT
jgi:hypothetical protein